MATQEAEHNLESVVYTWPPRVQVYLGAPCFGERLSFHADVGNAHESYTMLFW